MHRSHPSHSAKTAAAPLGALSPARSDTGQACPDAAPAVREAPAGELPRAVTEVDARSIAGGVGTVTLYLTDGLDAQRYVVNVERAGGECVARITADTRAEALDAYLHPFARGDVPDIFSDAA